MKKIYSVLLTGILVLGFNNFLAAQSSVLTGMIKDASTNQPLPGATIVFEGTSTGTVTNLLGEYRLMSIPQGSQSVIISFIGYVSQTYEIDIPAGEVVTVDASLDPDVVGLEEVVVTAQMLGQAKAINQQLTSDALVNVVSSDKMKELPDVNAAEAIGRLPGISVIRTGGEASRVIIRGLSPNLTSININGVRVPPSGAGDRSVDLSIISPDLLSNIEVYKSPTADMDGDAIGGIVNLGISRAPLKPQGTVRLYGGYNGLKSELGNYKGTLDLSRRFLNNSLGVIFKTNYEQLNRSSETINITYDTDNVEQFLVDALNITDEYRVYTRTGGSLQLDYQYRSGSVVAQGFYSERYNDLRIWNNDITNAETVGHTPRHIKTDISTLQGIISGKQNLPWMEIDWLLAQSKTVSDNFYDVRLQIVETAGVEQTEAPVTPQELFAKRLFNYNQAWIHRYYFEPSINDQVNTTASMDFKVDYRMGSRLGGFLKFGGKYRGDVRSRNVNHQIQNWYYLQPQARTRAIELWPYEMVLGGISGDMLMIHNFYSSDADRPVWSNEYAIHPNIDMKLLDEWHHYQKSTLVPQYDKEYLNYDVDEKVFAGYLMAKINLGSWFSFIPGVRYEHSDNVYTGVVSSLDFNASSGSKWDTTTYQNYGEFLPNFHLKIKPLDWFDIRMSAVKTLARPDYNMVTPRAYLDISNGRIWRGNPDLKYAEAWNYDAMFSFFSNKLGLFTIGGFFKQFDNYFTNTQRSMSAAEAESLGYPVSAYDVREDFVNFDDSKVYGLEVDLQTNFKYLPSPFNGIVLNVNSTRLWSETYQPLFFKVTKWDPVLRRFVVDFEASYWEYNKTSLPNQVDWISNASLGYDYKGFSLRISAAYQASYLRFLSSAGEGENVKYQNRYVDRFLKFDLSLSQKIGKHLMLMANLVNISAENEREYQYLPKYPRNENRYGTTLDVGMQFKF